MLRITPMDQRIEEAQEIARISQQSKQYIEYLLERVPGTTGSPPDKFAKYLMSALMKHESFQIAKTVLLGYAVLLDVEKISTAEEKHEAAKRIVACEVNFPYEGRPTPEHLQPLLVHTLLNAADEARKPAKWWYVLRKRTRKDGVAFVTHRKKAPDGFIPARDLPLFSENSLVPEMSLSFWIQARRVELLYEELNSVIKPIEETRDRLLQSSRRGRPKWTSQYFASPEEFDRRTLEAIQAIKGKGHPTPDRVAEHLGVCLLYTSPSPRD